MKKHELYFCILDTDGNLLNGNLLMIAALRDSGLAFNFDLFILMYLVQLLLCFSVVSNGEKILGTKKKPGNIPALDGIRFISTTWVILGHTVQAMSYGVGNHTGLY